MVAVIGSRRHQGDDDELGYRRLIASFVTFPAPGPSPPPPWPTPASAPSPFAAPRPGPAPFPGKVLPSPRPVSVSASPSSRRHRATHRDATSRGPPALQRTRLLCLCLTTLALWALQPQPRPAFSGPSTPRSSFPPSARPELKRCHGVTRSVRRSLAAAA